MKISHLLEDTHLNPVFICGFLALNEPEGFK